MLAFPLRGRTTLRVWFVFCCHKKCGNASISANLKRCSNTILRNCVSIRLRNAAAWQAGRVFAMNDRGSVPPYTTKGEKPQRFEMCHDMKQKNLLYQYLIIQAASDACASYLHKQMLHNAVASSVKAGGKWSTAYAAWSTLQLAAMYEAPLDSGMKQSLYSLHVFLPFYFGSNSKYVDYKQVASGLVIVFYCDWKNIVLRWFA